MESKKAISPLMLAIVVIIIGLITLVFVIVFFTSIGGKAGGELVKFFEVTKPTCQEKCTLEGYETGTCMSDTVELDMDCEKTVTDISDCLKGEICCCT